MKDKPRRSALAPLRDPIVIEQGFGTQQDLQRLSQSLNQSVDEVRALMARSSRRSRGSDKPAPATTPSSSAWADFLEEEGGTEGGADNDTSTASTGNQQTGTRKSKRGDKSKTDRDASTKSAASAAAMLAETTSSGDGEKDYVMPVQPWKSWMTIDNEKNNNNTDKGEQQQQQQEEEEEPPKKKPRSKAKKATTDTVDPTASGLLVQSGTLNCSVVGRGKPTGKPYDLPLPTILLPSVPIRRVIASCNSVHALAISADGQTLYGWGRNESGVLGHSLHKAHSLPTSFVPKPTALDPPKDLPDGASIVDGAVGKHHTILLDSEGNLYSVGNNKVGQCGIKSSIESVTSFRKCVFAGRANPHIVQVSCGEAFTVALDDRGLMHTTGSSEFGQLGNGETGEYFVAANKLAYANETAFTVRTVFSHVLNEKTHTTSGEKPPVVPINESIRIQHIACGKHHTVAIEAATTTTTTPPRVFTWGCGNYGCLGHGLQADEYFPRHVAAFRATPLLAGAGTSCSIVLTTNEHVHYWGKHRSVGESVMRPQLLTELAHNGHRVACVGAGNQTVVCCTKDAATVAWGQGPHGELGLETKKSSAKPTFVPKLDGCAVLDLACGYGNTYYVLHNGNSHEDAEDDKTKKQKKSSDNNNRAVEALPVITDEDLEELEELAEKLSK